MEQKIIKSVIQNRELFNLVRTLSVIYTPVAVLVFKEIEDYYDKDQEATEVDVDLLKQRLMLHNRKHGDMLCRFVDTLPETSVKNTQALLVEAQQDKLSDELSIAYANKQYSKARELHEQFVALREIDQVIGSEDEIICNPDIDTLLSKTVDDSIRIKLMPPSLNKMLQGVVRQQHIVVFGRPGLGKTSLVLNMIFGFIKQNLKVLYVGNEDPIYDTAMRLAVRVVQQPERTVAQMGRQEVSKLLSEANYGNVLFYDTASGDLRSLDRLCDKHKPDVFVVDQLRSVDATSESNTMRLEQVARGIRQIGKRHNALAISVTQAGESAEGKAVLTQGDVDGSKTGIQGACTTMIGFGATYDMIQSGVRVLSFPKTKVSHMVMPVQLTFNQAIAKME